MADAAQRRDELVVFGLADRVEFVVVAASTANGQSENGLADRVECILDCQVMIILNIKAEPTRNGDETGCCEHVPVSNHVGFQQTIFVLGD